MRAAASAKLARFLDFCVIGHMIDNVVLVVSGSLRDRDVQELLDKCHPLGRFEGLAALAVASSMRELYRLVLVDTPLAPYFAEELTAGKRGREGDNREQEREIRGGSRKKHTKNRFRKKNLKNSSSPSPSLPPSSPCQTTSTR